MQTLPLQLQDMYPAIQKGMLQNESGLKRDTANMTKLIFQLKKKSSLSSERH